MAAGKRRAERGIALVITLLILTLLVVTGLELNRAVQVEATLAGNFRDLTQASYIAQSGAEIARALIQEDEPSYDGLDEKWAQLGTLSFLSQQLFNEGHFVGQIVDENAKLNMNGLIDSFGNVVQKRKDQLERLALLLKHDPQFMDALLDWLDPDDQRRPQGAEKDDYLGKDLGYIPKNGPLDSLGEMLLIKGFSPEVFYGTEGKEGLKNYLTVNSDGRININTASVPVLISLSPKIDEPMAQAVLLYRREKPFRRLEDLRMVPGWDEVFPQISGEITIRSNFFSMEMVGYFREARAMVQAMIRREGKRTRVLYWKAG